MKVGSLHALHFSPGCEPLARMWTFAQMKKITVHLLLNLFQKCDGIMESIINTGLSHV